MLPDSGFIQEHDVKWFNKKRVRQGLPQVEPIYRKKDAEDCMSLFIGVPEDRKFHIDANIKVKFTNTGHMLGSGVANIEIEENGKITRIAYTGDIGRPSSHILRSPVAFPQCDYLITEATYGNRLHPASHEAENELLRVVNETCVIKGGKLIIPSFAIGRTQEVVFALNNYFNDGRLPKIEIYVDSPLAVNATEIFRLFKSSLNEDVAHVMETDPDPFGFSSLHYIKSVDDSKNLNFIKKPCIIISASGMMEAGRVKHHLANNISDPRNTILAVGYCAPRTLGARILDGEKEVSIFGVKHQVKANVERIEAFSGHGDYNEMKSFLNCQDKNQIKKVFLVHGEYEPQLFYKDQLQQSGYRHIEIPEQGTEVEL
jgi:metallo-beta-lactamase family protein